MTKVLKIMDRTGHTVVPITDATRAEAEATFKRVLAEGGTAFKMDGPTGTPIKKFSEVGEETILMPQLVGG